MLSRDRGRVGTACSWGAPGTEEYKKQGNTKQEPRHGAEWCARPSSSTSPEFIEWPLSAQGSAELHPRIKTGGAGRSNSSSLKHNKTHYSRPLYQLSYYSEAQ